MFGLSRKEKIHEPLAIAAVLAASISLHAVWILNLLGGTLSFIFLATTVVFWISFGVSALWFRGKDCSHFRDRVFWFFIASVIAFVILTMPAVYLFEIVGTNV